MLHWFGMSKTEVTAREILEFLQTNMVFRSEFDDFKNITNMRISHLENQMVTKDYLDNKFADFALKINQKIKECLCGT